MAPREAIIPDQSVTRTQRAFGRVENGVEGREDGSGRGEEGG